MVVLKIEPWSESRPSTPSSTKTLEMFGFQDLASDYYQVMREEHRPGWCRFVWGIVITILMLVTGYMVYQLLSDYFQYNSFNESSTIWQKNVTLPAITICNTNPLNYTKLKEELEEDNLLDEFENLMEAYVKHSTGQDLNFTEFSNVVEWEYMEGSLVPRFKPHLYKMVFGEFDYIFRGIGQYIDHFHFHKYSQLTELGVCFEINDDGSFQQSSGGVRGGLTIDLHATVNDYLFTTSTKGFVVFIRDQDETIMLNKGGYIVSPGSEAFLKLTARSLTRLGEPHGTCKNVESQFAKYGQHFETVRECVQRQKLDAMIEECSCIPWYLADRLYTLKKTDILDTYANRVRELSGGSSVSRRGRRQADVPTQESIEATTEWTTQEPLFKTNYSQLACGFVEMLVCDTLLEDAILAGERKLDDCPEPCEYHEWDVEISATLFPPSEEYFNRFIKEQVYMPEPPSFEYIRDNMARIHIYYDQMKVDKLVQTKAYEPQNFIAEFGGTVDLFIGFSFFTIFQLIEIALAICIARSCYYRNRTKLNARQDHVLNNPNTV